MKPLTFSLLRLLADGAFHSGEAMAQQLNISRATVWQGLQALGENGPEVFSIRGKGYRLAEPLVLLDEQGIRQALGEYRDRLKIEIVDCIASTNTRLMQKAGLVDVHGDVLIAELQTHGRGRRGKAWESGFGSSLTFSLAWKFEAGASFLSGLSLAVGVALVRSLNEYGLSDVRLKWPNDILHKYRKLAGILTEVQGDMLGPSVAIIGVGVNVNLSPAVKDRVDQAVTDVNTAGAMQADRNRLAAIILKNLAGIMDGFAVNGFSALRDEWMANDAYAGKSVNMLLPNGLNEKGRVAGIDDDGALLIENRYGVKRFNVGEISMRGDS